MCNDCNCDCKFGQLWQLWTTNIWPKLRDLTLNLCFLQQGDYVFGNICCLSLSNITQKVMNELQGNFMEGSGMVKGTFIKFWW